MSAMAKPAGRRDYWYAGAATVGLMMAWGLTPVGEVLTRRIASIDARLEDWAWPLVGLAFFWLCGLALFLFRKRVLTAQSNMR